MSGTIYGDIELEEPFDLEAFLSYKRFQYMEESVATSLPLPKRSGYYRIIANYWWIVSPRFGLVFACDSSKPLYNKPLCHKREAVALRIRRIVPFTVVKQIPAVILKVGKGVGYTEYEC